MVVLMVASELIPDRLLADRLVDSLESGDLSAELRRPTPSGGQADRFTECIVITVGLGDPVGTSPVETAVTNPTLGNCEQAVPWLQLYEQSGTLRQDYSYFRYWHASTPAYRVGITLFGLAGTRFLGLLSLLGAMVLALTGVSRRWGWWTATALFGPVVLTTDVLETAESLPHLVAWTLTFLVAAALSRMTAGPDDREKWLAAAAWCGTAAAFFDLMIALPANAALVLALTWLRSSGPAKERIRQVGLAGLAWGSGLGLTWVAKWVVALPFVGWQRVWDDAIGQVLFRVSGDNELADGGFGTATARAIDWWLDRPLAVPVVVVWLVAAVVLGSSIVRQSGRRGQWLAPLSMAAMFALAPLVWMEALSNHNQIHYWITYRALPIGLGAGLACLMAARFNGDDVGMRSD
ncbi:MAG: hypothetical protein R2754_12020 [Microthrixaceae bacterium]